MLSRGLTIAEWEVQRAEKLHLLARWRGQIPARGPVEIAELCRTEFDTHTELKVIYRDDTGAGIPAYLLLPRGSTTSRLPAILAAHQCAWACDIGKEQVVGNVPPARIKLTDLSWCDGVLSCLRQMRIRWANDSIPRCANAGKRRLTLGQANTPVAQPPAAPGTAAVAGNACTM